MITRRDATGSKRRRTSFRRLFLLERGHWILAGLVIAASSRILLGQGVKEFDIPYGTTSPRGIAAGADGNIWFADYLGEAIVRVTPAGVFTKFSVPTTYAYPMGATLGPDGNIWVTDYLFNRLDRVAPAGTVTEFPLPCIDPPLCLSSSGPLGIVVGPDGNLWIAEAVGKIGRATTSGTSRTLTFRPPAARLPASRPAPTATSGSPRATQTRSGGSRPAETSRSSR